VTASDAECPRRCGRRRGPVRATSVDDRHRQTNVAHHGNKRASSGVDDTMARIRFEGPVREQGVIRFEMPEDALPAEHPARVLWHLLGRLDLTSFTKDAKAVDGHAGRPVLCTRMLLTLWLYAISVGVGSAREIARRVRIDRVFDTPEEAVKKIASGDLDALIFVGGAPVPAFRNLDRSFHFVTIPTDSGLEQIYPKKKIAQNVYGWAGEVETHAVPSVIMTRNRDDRDFAVSLQKLVLSILVNKENLDANGHPKWKDSYVRSTLGSVGYEPTTEVIVLYNTLDSAGYRIIKK